MYRYIKKQEQLIWIETYNFGLLCFEVLLAIFYRKSYLVDY